MRTPRRTLAILVAGAVALASAACAIGTQVGGGSAVADDSGRFFAPGERLGHLADRLGVGRDELRDALAEFGSEHRSKRVDAFAADLADALGKSTGEVERALRELRDEAAPRGRLHRDCGPLHFRGGPGPGFGPPGDPM